MKKILALVLTLAMMLTMLNVGFVASAAEESKPAGAIAISDADGLASMVAGNYYYLTADITLGSPQYNTIDEETGLANPDDIDVPAEEADRIIIPAGVTLDGNGYTIYQGFYKVDNGWYDTTNNKYTHSQAWTHEMFLIQAGATVTIKNISFGSQELPVYLSSAGAKDAGGNVVDGYTVNDTFGIFADESGANTVWTDVNFYVERYGRGLGSFNIGPVMFKPLGTNTFTDCTMNVSIMSAGSQYGGWFYNATGATSFTNCHNNGFEIYVGTSVTTDPDTSEEVVTHSYQGNAMWGSVGGGFIHTARANVYMYNCSNNVDISATYGGTGYKFGGLVGEIAAGDLYVENCVNTGDFSLHSISIGGGLVGRGQNGSNDKFQIINSANYGNIKRSSSTVMTSNHGFGGIAGHTSANSVYELINCVNYGDIQGVGNVGGIVGLIEGTAPTKVLQNCVNYGNITTVGAVEVAGIAAQPRTYAEITGCKNYGDVNAKNASYSGGIIGRAYSGDKVIANCENYGDVGATTMNYAGGIMAQNSASVDMDNCVNYGKITTKQYSGGMIAEATNVVSTITMDNCFNYGEIAGVHAVGGFIGQVNNSENIQITITKCLNAGYIHQGPAAGEGIGGFLGRIAGAKTIIKINQSVNTGTVLGSTKDTAMYGSFGDCFGQFIGTYTVQAAGHFYTGGDIANANIVGGFIDYTAEGITKIALNNCFAYGTAKLADGAMSLKGWITATDNGDGPVTELAQANFIKSTVPVTEAPNGGVCGINVAYTGTVRTLETVPADTAITQINSLLGIKMMAGADGEDQLVKAVPELRGYQQSTDGKDLRVLATVASKNYETVGFTYTVNVGGNDVLVNQTATCEYVMESINARGDDGAIESKDAASMGGKYFSAITFVNVPTNQTVVITVTPNAGAYTGAAYTITIVNGVVTGAVAA